MSYKSARLYVAVKRAPWQSECDRCGQALASPFYWAASRYHGPFKTICAACFQARTDPARYEPCWSSHVRREGAHG